MVLSTGLIIPSQWIDDGSCEYDCAGVCGGNLVIDCGGVCNGDNATALNCCGFPFNDDCISDCYEDYYTGEWCPIWDVDGCGVCYGDGTVCNDGGIPDDCEEVYDLGNAEGYTTELEEGIFIGSQSGDANGDGVLNILDIVYFVDVILNPNFLR